MGLILVSICILLALVSLFFYLRSDKQFSGKQAYIFAKYQVDLGPRIPDSDAHELFRLWAKESLISYGWHVSEQTGEIKGHQLTNLQAQKGSGSDLIIIGAHYDSRMKADQDKIDPTQPVPGANDGASGAAVLMELARTVNVPQGKTVRLVLFDLEDQGKLDGWDWILGSSYYSEHLEEIPKAVVIIDMIGDSALNIKKERNSDQELNDEIWQIADRLGFSGQFIDAAGFSMLDDHTPFLRKGLRSVDLIDFDYPYWHTTQDTLDKISAESLEAVGRVLEYWIEN